MNRPVWKEPLFPTLLLGGLWLGFSLSTTWYIAWLDGGYQRVTEENVATLLAVDEMREVLWNLHDTVASLSGSVISADASPQSGADTRRMQEALDAAGSAARTEVERQEVSGLRRTFDEYRELLQSLDRSAASDLDVISRMHDRSRRLVAEMSARCNHLREINRNLIRAASTRRDIWSRRVGGTRIVLTFLGPVLGIWLGFRAASRVRRRLGEIRVRLEGASGEVGRLSVSATSKGSDLNELDGQVVAITRRMDGVLQQLHSARHEVLRSERLAAVGQLAAGVAHELRNPLTSVKLLVQIVARGVSAESRTAAQLGVVQDEIVRMERTIQSLLDFARPPVQNRLCHDLRDTLRRAINLVGGRATRDRILIEQTLPTSRCEVDGDPEQLHQVFLNLLLNSMDAMPEGGRLGVSLHLEADASGEPRTCLATLSDSGSGIPETVIARLFEPFVTTKERGTGLGLAVSRRIIEEHAGTLTAANAPEGGAIFSVRLPVVTPSEHAGAVSFHSRH